jgi:hypothetical protein
MGFKTDGSSHHNGIKNEERVLHFLQRNPNAFKFEDRLGNLIEIQKKGGTGSKDDLISLHEGGTAHVSVKRHKGEGGTHDWVNSSAIIRNLREQFPEFDSKIRAVEKLTKDRHGQEHCVETHREDVKQLGSDLIEWFNNRPGVLKGILKDIALSLMPQDIILTSVKEKQHNHYKGADHPIQQKLKDPNWFPTLVRSTAKSSAQIDGTSWRLRIVTNNGIKAMLGGFGKRNKYSSIVLKIQQENVKMLLEEINKQGKLIRIPYE